MIHEVWANGKQIGRFVNELEQDAKDYARSMGGTVKSVPEKQDIRIVTPATQEKLTQ